MANIIDGKATAQALRAEIAAQTRRLRDETGVVPGLAAVIVGEDPASRVYVRNKGKQARQAGFQSFNHQLSSAISEPELLALVERLNRDPAVHGILVQLPLPEQIDPQRVIEAIDPQKDVDGFHPINVGKLVIGADGFVPCTPLGCLLLIKACLSELSGLHAVVVGRSNIVGKPVASLLLRENCTVTQAHSRTRDLKSLCRSADILVAAVGRAKMIAGDWVKPGAVVIDVGINRIPGDEGRSRLVGDVDFEAAAHHAAHITPVPGGVGPMTIACLLRNTLDSARRAGR